MFRNFSIKAKITFCLLASSLLVLIVGYIAIRSLDQVAQPLQKDLPQNIQLLSQESKLDGLAQNIRYYDEVLTQSARNYAFTQDVKWKDRYNTEAPKLDTNIKEAISLGDQKDRDFFASVDAANLALVKMETDAMNLVDNNNPTAAIKILESQEYWNQKSIYKNGLAEYLARRGSNYEQAMSI
jgi:hypothetical protein